MRKFNHIIILIISSLISLQSFSQKTQGHLIFGMNLPLSSSDFMYKSKPGIIIGYGREIIKKKNFGTGSNTTFSTGSYINKELVSTSNSNNQLVINEQDHANKMFMLNYEFNLIYYILPEKLNIQLGALVTLQTNGFSTPTYNTFTFITDKPEDYVGKTFGSAADILQNQNVISSPEYPIHMFQVGAKIGASYRIIDQLSVGLQYNYYFLKYFSDDESETLDGRLSYNQIADDHRINLLQLYLGYHFVPSRKYTRF